MKQGSDAAVSYARLLVALLLFILSSLIFVAAPTHSLWEISIAVTERGYFLIPIALIAAFASRQQSIISRLATTIALLASAILLVPLSQAAEIENGLAANLDRAFHAPPAIAAHRGGTLSLASLLKPGQNGPGRVLYFPVTDSSSTRSDSLGVDFYPARGNLHAPLVVMIHGGSWQSGARTDLPELNSYLASLGYAVAAPSYRFAPAHPFPAALNDIRSALAFLRAQSGDLGIDTTRIVIAGRSAGGQLALLLAYTARDPTIRGAIGLYAPADMVWGYNHPSDPRVLNSTEALEAYLGGSPSTAEPRYLDASPFGFASATRVPTLLIHGTRDELVSVMQSRRLDRRLAHYAAPHFLLELPWATHGCDYFITGPCGQLEAQAVARFLSIVTR